jgi:hypothetical protein
MYDTSWYSTARGVVGICMYDSARNILSIGARTGDVASTARYESIARSTALYRYGNLPTKRCCYELG